MAETPASAIAYALKGCTWRIDGEKLVIDLRGPVHAADVVLAMEAVAHLGAFDT